MTNINELIDITIAADEEIRGRLLVIRRIEPVINRLTGSSGYVITNTERHKSVAVGIIVFAVVAAPIDGVKHGSPPNGSRSLPVSFVLQLVQFACGVK